MLEKIIARPPAQMLPLTSGAKAGKTMVVTGLRTLDSKGTSSLLTIPSRQRPST